MQEFCCSLITFASELENAILMDYICSPWIHNSDDVASSMLLLYVEKGIQRFDCEHWHWMRDEISNFVFPAYLEKQHHYVWGVGGNIAAMTNLKWFIGWTTEINMNNECMYFGSILTSSLGTWRQCVDAWWAKQRLRALYLRQDLSGTFNVFSDAKIRQSSNTVS